MQIKISTIFVLIIIGLSLAPSGILNIQNSSYAQVSEYIDEDGNFSIAIPPNWEIVPKPDNSTITLDSSPPTVEETEFPYYGQNTAIALKLKGISEMDFDKHTYITITVRDVEKYVATDSSDVNIKSLDEVVNEKIRFLETGLSERIYYDIISHNSTMTLGGEPAYQIKYVTTLVPFDYYNVDTITIHNDKLYDVYFNTGELFSTQTLPYMDDIINSFRFLN